MPSGWWTAAQLLEWLQRYDAAETNPMVVSLEANGWTRCYCSDARRAVATAAALFPAGAVPTPLLREAGFCEFRTGQLKLPCWVWQGMLRLTWMTGHRSQRSARDEFRRRVLAVADLIESEQSDILLISHAGMMSYLRSELGRRGFSGPRYGIAEHGKLYIFQRGSA
jgi:broad specificity phosphatase PhoE